MMSANGCEHTICVKVAQNVGHSLISPKNSMSLSLGSCANSCGEGATNGGDSTGGGVSVAIGTDVVGNANVCIVVGGRCLLNAGLVGLSPGETTAGSGN